MKKILSTLALSLLLVGAANAQRRTITYLTFEGNAVTTPDAQDEFTSYTLASPDFVQNPSGGPAIDQQLAWRKFNSIGTSSADIIATPGGIANPGSVNLGSQVLETAEFGGDLGGLYLYTETNASIPAQDVTIECIWYSTDLAPAGHQLGIQTIWGKETLVGQELAGLQLRAIDDAGIGRTAAMEWRAEEAVTEVLIQNQNANAVNTWYHDTLVFDFDETTSSSSTMRAYRNGVEVSGSPTTVDASTWPGMLFTLASDFTGDAVGDRFLGIGFNTSSQGTTPDNIRGLVGGIDAFAITLGSPLTPAEFVLTTGAPFDAPGGSNVEEWMHY